MSVMDGDRAPGRAALIVALGISWVAAGGSFIGMRVVTQALPPVTTTAVRMAGALLILLAPFAWRLRKPANRPNGRELVGAAVSGLLLLVIGQCLLVVGVSMTPAGTAAVFGSSSPLLLALLTWAVTRQPIGGLRTAGLLLGFAGLVLMGWSAVAAGGLSLPGVAAILVSAAAWAAGSFFGQHHPMPRDPVVSVTLQTATAAVLIGGLALVSGEAGRVDLGALRAVDGLAMASVIVTGLMLFGSFTWLNANASGALANTFTYVAPVLTLALGALLLGEPLTPAKAAAAAVTLVGVALIVSGGEGERAREPRSELA